MTSHGETLVSTPSSEKTPTDGVSAERPRKTVITFGTYDLFHYGHVRIIQRAAAFGDRLVVGVSSDDLNYSKKQLRPAVKQEQRMAIVAAMADVDEVFLEESLELKKEYCLRYGADILVMGDDHLNEYNDLLAGVCECAYMPRTRSVSTTQLKAEISSSNLAALGNPQSDRSPKSSPSSSPRNSFSIAASPAAASASSSAYSAAKKNLVRGQKQTMPMMEFLVAAHDRYYDLVMVACTPFCAWMPRSVTVPFSGSPPRQLTVFTANIVTYFRGLLTIAIVGAMKYGFLKTACALVLWHDFLDHLDGVVAKQQARDGRSKGDDGAFGAFVDAQMDKLVFCLCLWSFITLSDWGPIAHPFDVNVVVVATSALLFALEFTIACVRTGDYFRAKYAPRVDAQGNPSRAPALRAVSEGKLKQKFESVGISLYCLSLPAPADPSAALTTLAGTVCLWFAAYFSYQSLLHKLRARAD